MKKIVFLDQRLGGGGAEKVLCTVMRALNPSEYEVHLVVTSQIDDLGHLVPSTVKVHELGIDSTRKALVAFVKVIHKIKPDIVFASLTRSLVLAVIARFVAPSYRVVGRYPTMPSKEISGGYLKGWRLTVTKLLLGRVDCLIAQTKAMKTDIEAVFGLDPKQVIAINNPMDVGYMKSCVEGKETPYAEGTLPILGVGTLYPVKGFDILIQAFAKVLPEHSNARLHLVGKDHQGGLAELQSLAERLGVEEYLYFHGFQPNPYVFFKYGSLFVLSSRREGMPNVLLEAQYFNLPVVATKCVPIIEELVIDGENGWSCEVEDVNGMAECISKSLALRNITNSQKATIDQFVKLF